jgi:uncharacterized protein YdaU (DUF1376 family)
MSNGTPWVRFFPSDWLTGTRSLSASETGVYITLVAMMYDHGAPIEADTGTLARLCNLAASRFVPALNKLIAAGKIIRTDEGKLWNERVQKEHEHRLQTSYMAQQKSFTRWGKKASKNNAAPMPVDLPGNASQNLDIKEKEIPIGISKKKAANGGFQKPKKTPFRLSENWKIPPEWVAEAVSEGLTQAGAMAEAERMKNWSLANPKGAKLDWHATWKNWFRQKIEQHAQSPPHRAAETSRQTDDAFRELLRRKAQGN